MRYHWQQKDGPDYQYKIDGIEEMPFDFAQCTGRISSVLEGFSETKQTETKIWFKRVFSSLLVVLEVRDMKSIFKGMKGTYSILLLLAKIIFSLCFVYGWFKD